MADADADDLYAAMDWSLAQVERAFRSIKTMDLKVRPIHHRLEGRVRAHILLCMLAYYVEWHIASTRCLRTPGQTAAHGRAASPPHTGVASVQTVGYAPHS